jgi:hypothetical protein
MKPSSCSAEYFFAFFEPQADSQCTEVHNEWKIMHFRKINCLCGWLVFTIAAAVYLNTLEPSVSFWDCGEFIACAFRLEVGHQPGAPLFLLLGRFFSLLAGNNAHMVAKMVNCLSALASALTILFLFWTITRLAEKAISQNYPSSPIRNLTILSSGFAGAMACTFSDTFWFSAVEGEVYATSALFTAIAFWAILKWEASAAEENADRWILFIAFLMGLSIGVHLLNLLTIPAIVMVYYFRKYPADMKGILYTILFSFVLLYLVVFVLIPWLIRLAAWFDLLFVNGFGLPFNTGTIFYITMLISFFIMLLRFSHKRRNVFINKITLALILFCMGYSSYIVLAIRARANPPVNLNRVEDPFSLLAYITREQYISRPIFYGPYYNAPVIGYKSRHTYAPSGKKYKITDQNARYLYDKRFMTLFPRMSSDDPQDIAAYRKWGEIKGIPVHVVNREGKPEILLKPTFRENLRFFFRYQLGHMYFRYFMWNFAGRQTENQSNGSILNGNWISGIPLIDEWRLGPQENFPHTLKVNKGRNVYYCLPLLLGIIGLIYQFNRNRRDFIVLMLFFLLTGAAIVIYLNEVPLTPRERDYATGGSFYVFCVWIGLGTTGVTEFLKKRIPAAITFVLAVFLCVLFIPALMAKENLDDHDRSRRYVARDFAFDYLNSCAPDAILFTNADNDTYPLWYLQQVEGIRTDVRVILAPFLSADWYIKQLADWHDQAAPVPLTISANKYGSGKLNAVPYYKRTDQYANLKDVIEFIGSDDPGTMLRAADDSGINYLPTRFFRIPAGTAQTDPNRPGGEKPPGGSTSDVDFTIKTKALWKHEIVLLDIIASNNWRRPVYFLSTQVPRELGLLDYLKMDGFAYRLVPDKHPTDGYTNVGSVHADELYDKLMNQFRWGNMNDPKVFMDYNSARTTGIIGIRSCFARLAEEYIQHGNPHRAIQVLDRCMELMPDRTIPYDILLLPVISAYYHAGAAEKARRYTEEYRNILQKEMDYYASLSHNLAKTVDYEMKFAAYVLQELDALPQAGE